MSSAHDAGPESRELILTRIIDAPREAVFKAWTDPKLVKQWWAPRPWTTPHAEIDLRPGGVCRTVMRSPGRRGLSERGRLSRSRPERADRLHRRLQGGLGAFGQAVHDGPYHLRRCER
jgi:uncharacterized protein YndB with AHSA1/START domain